MIFFPLGGCIWAPHEVALDIPPPEISDQQIGEGTSLRLRVLDERDDSNLGSRGAGISGADVTAAALMDEFALAVETGYTRKGYLLTDNPTVADATLDVALRGMKFDEQTGFWTIGANVSITIIAEAERQQRDYTNAYRFTDEERQLVISFGSGIDESINEAIAIALQKLFDDRSLDAVLCACHDELATGGSLDEAGVSP